MMDGFSGFPAEIRGMTRIPDLFFSDLLPKIDHIIELKVTLYCFWALKQQEGTHRYLRLSEALLDETLWSALGATTAETAHDSIQDGFERAVARGTLLSAKLQLQGTDDMLFVVNSERGRTTMTQLENGSWSPEANKRPIKLAMQRPNIFVLYEQNIGVITPMVADRLRDAEEEYPDGWVADAMEIAIENNARKWSYIQAILDRWMVDGKQERNESSERDSSQFGDKKGDFSDFYGT